VTPVQSPSYNPFQQRRLAHAGFAMHHQDAAAPATRCFQEPAERLALTLAAEQLRSLSQLRVHSNVNAGKD
jgi:hypothetical protein